MTVDTKKKHRIPHESIVGKRVNIMTSHFNSEDVFADSRQTSLGSMPRQKGNR
jgi:hypothetical protein